METNKILNLVKTFYSTYKNRVLNENTLKVASFILFLFLPTAIAKVLKKYGKIKINNSLLIVLVELSQFLFLKIGRKIIR